MAHRTTSSADSSTARIPFDALTLLNPTVYIVGRSMPNNIMLSYLLKSELSANCACHEEMPLKRIGSAAAGSLQFVLLDCMDLDIGHIERFLNRDEPPPSDLPIVLFNVSANLKFDPLVQKYGIRGIFYKDDGKNTFLRGMGNITEGRSWIRHKQPQKRLKPRSGGATVSYRPSPQKVSKREVEILKLLTAGMSNKQIANEFGISLHTVKTHIYNIYKKIHVPNRLQAALWATAHLPGEIDLHVNCKESRTV